MAPLLPEDNIWTQRGLLPAFPVPQTSSRRRTSSQYPSQHEYHRQIPHYSSHPGHVTQASHHSPQPGYAIQGYFYPVSPGMNEHTVPHGFVPTSQAGQASRSIHSTGYIPAPFPQGLGDVPTPYQPQIVQPYPSSWQFPVADMDSEPLSPGLASMSSAPVSSLRSQHQNDGLGPYGTPYHSSLHTRHMQHPSNHVSYNHMQYRNAPQPSLMHRPFTELSRPPPKTLRQSIDDSEHMYENSNQHSTASSIQDTPPSIANGDIKFDSGLGESYGTTPELNVSAPQASPGGLPPQQIVAQQHLALPPPEQESFLEQLLDQPADNLDLPEEISDEQEPSERSAPGELGEFEHLYQAVLFGRQF